MKVYKNDFSEMSEPLIKNKYTSDIDITSEKCKLCGKSVQKINGKLKRHNCITLEGIR